MVPVMVCIAVSPPSITPWLYVHVVPNIANEILISSPPCLGYFYSYVPAFIFVFLAFIVYSLLLSPPLLVQLDVSPSLIRNLLLISPDALNHFHSSNAQVKYMSTSKKTKQTREKYIRGY